MYWKIVSRTHAFATAASGVGRSGTADVHRLAYMEMRLVLARLLFKLDMAITDESRDWNAHTRPYNLWYKPPLYVQIVPREIGTSMTS